MLDHPADCPGGMECPICACRCYDGFPGHYFKGDGKSNPCECGFFKNIGEAQAAEAELVEVKK